MVGALLDAPRRVRHPLQRGLGRLGAARRGPYRVVYEIDDVQRAINVVPIDHQADIYRSR